MQEAYTGLEILMESETLQIRNSKVSGKAWVGSSKLAVGLLLEVRRGLVNSCNHLQHISTPRVSTNYSA